MTSTVSAAASAELSDPESAEKKSWTPYERETVVNASDGDDQVRIWTAQRKYITRLRKNPKAHEVGGGFYGTSEWAEFVIPAAEWNPVSGVKRNVTMTEEQKRVAGDRLRQMREGKAA